MPTLYLLIGSNQDDRLQTITQAADLIRQRIGSVVACSHIYETAPWGTFADGEKPQNFYNQALEVSTTLSPHEALKEALAIEHQLGRRRKEIEDLLPHPDNSQLYSSRPIDIDLIFYGDAVIDTPKLTIPHPRMHLRRFVLQPMCEIAPCYKHPILNKTLTELLNECTDTSSCLCCSL